MASATAGAGPTSTGSPRPRSATFRRLNVKRKVRKAAKVGKPEGTTFVSFILDETGSMSTCWQATVSGFNEYLRTLRQRKDKVRFTLTLFNSVKLEVRH